MNETQEKDCGPGTQLRNCSLRGSMSDPPEDRKANKQTNPVKRENGVGGSKELGLGHCPPESLWLLALIRQILGQLVPHLRNPSDYSTA